MYKIKRYNLGKKSPKKYKQYRNLLSTLLGDSTRFSFASYFPNNLHDLESA